MHEELTSSTYIQTPEEWLMLCGQLAVIFALRGA